MDPSFRWGPALSWATTSAMSDRACAVYMLANKPYGTLYLGCTSDLLRRVWEHKQGIGSVFTRKHEVTKLVWFEVGDWYDGVRQRERQMKAWKRAWKIDLIERDNPMWDDLYDRLN